MGGGLPTVTGSGQWGRIGGSADGGVVAHGVAGLAIGGSTVMFECHESDRTVRGPKKPGSRFTRGPGGGPRTGSGVAAGLGSSGGAATATTVASGGSAVTGSLGVAGLALGGSGSEEHTCE